MCGTLDPAPSSSSSSSSNSSSSSSNSSSNSLWRAATPCSGSPSSLLSSALSKLFSSPKLQSGDSVRLDGQRRPPSPLLLSSSPIADPSHAEISRSGPSTPEAQNPPLLETKKEVYSPKASVDCAATTGTASASLTTKVKFPSESYGPKRKRSSSPPDRTPGIYPLYMQLPFSPASTPPTSYWHEQDLTESRTAFLTLLHASTVDGKVSHSLPSARLLEHIAASILPLIPPTLLSFLAVPNVKEWLQSRCQANFLLPGSFFSPSDYESLIIKWSSNPGQESVLDSPAGSSLAAVPILEEENETRWVAVWQNRTDGEVRLYHTPSNSFWKGDSSGRIDLYAFFTDYFHSHRATW